jgi:hypothetical protein
MDRLWVNSQERFDEILKGMDLEDLLALNKGLQAVIRVAAQNKGDHVN